MKWAMSLRGRGNLPFHQQGDCFAASLLAMTSNLFSPASTNRRSVRLSGKIGNTFSRRHQVSTLRSKSCSSSVIYRIIGNKGIHFFQAIIGSTRIFRRKYQ